MEVDELYGLAPDRFVPERTALARELRAAGQRAEADSVAALRKPSVAAHVVNRLIRREPTALGRLWEAGDALIAAQADLLGGRADGRALAQAVERERALVDELVAAASEHDHLTTSVRDRVSETLHAAALDEAAREPVAAGRLERELRHVGLGTGTATATASAPPAARRSTRDRPQRDRDRDRDREREHARAQERKQAVATERAARQQAQRAAKALRGAETSQARAAEALRRSEDELATARAQAEAAQAAHRQARERLSAL